MKITKKIEKILLNCLESGLLKKYDVQNNKINITYYDDHKEVYNNKDYLITDLSNMSVYYIEDKQGGCI